MAFEDLKDQLREQVQSLTGRIQESSAWQQLMEKYQDLSPRGQKVALAAIGVLAALIVFAIPYSFYSSSQTSLTEFEDRKQMMRDLYRVDRTVKSLPEAPPPVSTDELKSSIDSLLAGKRLLPEQRAPIADFDNAGPAASSAIPKNLQQKGVIVPLLKLNLEQVVSIGSELQNIRGAPKLVGIEIRANRETSHYFDVTYKLVTFALPPEPAANAKPGARGGNNSRGANKE